MVQLSSTGLICDSPQSELDELRQEFAQFHTIKIKNFLQQDVLQLIRNAIELGEFQTRVDKKIAVELCMSENIGLHGLNLLMNDQRLFSFIQSITGCNTILQFTGRVYRMEPRTDHHDSWHDDDTGERMVGMSINLSPTPYEGGQFEIMNSTTGQFLRAMPNQGLGDAIIFRIQDGLKHRITAMDGDRPKTAFAGWFQNNPGFFSRMKTSRVNL